LFGFRVVGRGPDGRERYGSALIDPSLLRDERTERWLVPDGVEHLLQAHETLRVRATMDRATAWTLLHISPSSEDGKGNVRLHCPPV